MDEVFGSKKAIAYLQMIANGLLPGELMDLAFLAAGGDEGAGRELDARAEEHLSQLESRSGYVPPQVSAIRPPGSGDGASLSGPGSTLRFTSAFQGPDTASPPAATARSVAPDEDAMSVKIDDVVQTISRVYSHVVGVFDDAGLGHLAERAVKIVFGSWMSDEEASVEMAGVLLARYHILVDLFEGLDVEGAEETLAAEAFASFGEEEMDVADRFAANYRSVIDIFERELGAGDLARRMAARAGGATDPEEAR